METKVKKGRNHKQQREERMQQRQQNLARPQPPAGTMFPVPRLCRRESLLDLCRIFYQKTGVDLFIDIPGNVEIGPRDDQVLVLPGQEAQFLGSQLNQLYAVCFNATMKNASRTGRDKSGSTPGTLDILLELADTEKRKELAGFLAFINYARQFFCHYSYLWPMAVSGKDISLLRNYLEIHCDPELKADGVLKGMEEYTDENVWLRFQKSILRSAEDLYDWLADLAEAHGEDPEQAPWKAEISLLYLPRTMNDQMRRNWDAPINWWWKKTLLSLRRSDKETFDYMKLVDDITEIIRHRENGKPHYSVAFVPLQTQIYQWAEQKLRSWLHNTSQCNNAAGKGFRRKSYL